ncbi:bacillithiol biosynthesis cysteine-adding enzyme BshC [Flavobacterium aciduliphilum]|uniref:Putative cysteine ligase BshC n=1 Tax=Flavobacterium aciduliphilum TaxID=1101402 RepID=A0A328YYL7_9FLAO|nr:bacillithiol biosynthesis cysteine-adding enzyme BshC [Flavobacterium aciduliphilum]RAR75637.1 bacillithiol biosynthesis cysteine-adding enzyme BshC [Flavobacterium aciduliphilum]
MDYDCISYQKSGYFTKLMMDYLDEKPELKQLYNRFPTLDNFKAQIVEKQHNYPFEHREILVSELEKQYACFEPSETTLNHIKLLNLSNTFTITTGHQLNLFTGPLYFIYKIVSTINLCKQLKKEYPENNFVPVYWMATEDHDFEEISFFYCKGQKIQWNRESSGPVGRLSTAGLDVLLTIFSNEIGTSENALALKKLFENAYLNHTNLADATRYLINELFKDEGLVIIDGDSVALKKVFIPYVEKELLEQTSYKKVTETNTLLKDYDVQVNPRELNLFYMENNLRERIVLEKETYKINNTSIQFSKVELLSELENHPEKFSPNVILRPLYQEVLLPNLAYIGGGGELAYWLELKSNFEANTTTFPILVLRNSALLAHRKQEQKIKKLGLTWQDLFVKQQELLNRKVSDFSNITIDFTEQKEILKKQFEALYKIAQQTDKSFIGAVKAQEVKQMKGLDHIEKRLLKAEKRVHHDLLVRIVSIQNELFPNQSLQERKANFSEFYIEYGQEFFKKIGAFFDPLDAHFSILIFE